MVATQILFRDLALAARVRQAEIVRSSGLSTPTVQRIMRGEKVSDVSLGRALDVINVKLGHSYQVGDIEQHEDGK
jgi:transcriptional regulator with XRE-family HTH domain